MPRKIPPMSGGGGGESCLAGWIETRRDVFFSSSFQIITIVRSFFFPPRCLWLYDSRLVTCEKLSSTKGRSIISHSVKTASTWTQEDGTRGLYRHAKRVFSSSLLSRYSNESEARVRWASTKQFNLEILFCSSVNIFFFFVVSFLTFAV